MPQFDLPLDELRAYRPDLPRPDDFDDFWAATLAEARAVTRSGRPSSRSTTGWRVVDTFDVTFPGFGGSPIRGWLHLPVGRAPDRCPASCEYVGYGGGRGLAARADPVGDRGLRAPGDGHARAGVDAGPSATRPTRTATARRRSPAS